MLIEGAIRFGRQAEDALQKGDQLGAAGPLLRVIDIVGELLAGVRSGFTYSGAFHQQELREIATFIEVSQHGYTEGTPHGISRDFQATC